MLRPTAEWYTSGNLTAGNPFTTFIMSLFGLGPQELLLILVLLLLFFGKDKLPELARSVGHSFRELKKGFSEEVAADKTEEAAKSGAKKS